MTTPPDHVLIKWATEIYDHERKRITTLTPYRDGSDMKVNQAQMFVYSTCTTDKEIKKQCDAVTGEMRERNTAVNHRVDEVESTQANLKRRIEEVYQQHSGQIAKVDQETNRIDVEVRHVKTQVVEKIKGILVEEIIKEAMPEIAQLQEQLDTEKKKTKELENRLDNVEKKHSDQMKTILEELKKLQREVTQLRHPEKCTDKN